MDPDQPAHPLSLIRIHAVRLQTLSQIEKLIACQEKMSALMLFNLRKDLVINTRTNFQDMEAGQHRLT
jgi:hypothetical protein